MVRVYIRKTERGKSYTDEQMQMAVEDVRNGRKSLRGAANDYKIPRSTLMHRVKGTRGKKGCSARNGSGGGGKRQLCPDHETELVRCLKTMETWGFALTRKEILEIVQVFIQKNNIVTNFKNDKPGEEWFLGFKRRNNFSIKKPQHVECARMKSRNPFIFYGFYELLSTTIKQLQLIDKPSHIFNCDETSFCSDPKKTKVVGTKGNRTIRMTAGTGRENTSVLICASASGDLLPPLCIFKGQNVLESWVSTQPSDQCAYAANKKGWMNTVLFSKWFQKCFLPFVSDKVPALLIYDGHSSHINTQIIEEALQHGVTILKLPPHTTDILQPLDVAVNKSLKDRWDHKLVQWQRANPRKRIPKQLFVGILNQVLNETPKSVIINGFKKTGICDMDVVQEKGIPVNENVINEKIFNSEDLKRYQKYKEEQKDIVLKNAEDNVAEAVLSIQEVEEEICVTDEVAETITAADVDVRNTNEEVCVTETGNIPKDNSFESILLKFIAKSKSDETGKTSRRRICPDAEIITTPEFLNKLKKEEEEKKRKLEKKAGNKSVQKATCEEKKKLEKKAGNKSVMKVTCEEEKKKKSEKKTGKKSVEKASSAAELCLPSTSGYEKKIKHPTPQLTDSSEDSMSWSSQSVTDDDNSVENTPCVLEKDYVIVSYENGYYPGQVTEISDSPNEQKIKISCMQEVGTSGDIWKWPTSKDELWYSESDILKIIYPPLKINNRGCFNVPEMKKLTHY